MTQSKGKSLMEAIANTFVGYLITLLLSPLLYWIADVKANWVQMNLLTLLFTIISIVRNYLIRRWFNRSNLIKL